MMMRRRLACFTRDMRGMSNDFDEQERVTTYDGLESCIMNSNSYDNESGSGTSNGCVTDSFDEDDSSCSSSANAFGSFSSISISIPMWTTFKKDEEEWKHSDVEAMKEKFAKLLLGNDVTGGARGVSSAFALSNAITNLAASVFGELWKLEPLPEERKRKWRREMDWFLTPTNYMVELVPANQNHPNGRTMEIMTPKARADIHMNLPALKKLDSMLIETLESMVDTEFWYAELGSRAEGRSTWWWLPSPRVPAHGLSVIERKRLLHIGKHIHQVFKAAKSINEHVLAEMPIPSTIKDALPKSGRANLGEELYKILTAESLSIEDMISCLNLKSEHSALQAVNRLEAAVFTWRERIAEQGSKTPVRASSWSFVRDHMSALEKREAVVKQAELLLLQLKSKYPNLPQTFLDVTRIQYGKDVGHAILEAYSRVVANIAFSILSRLGDILQEDIMSNPKSPVAMSNLVGARIPGISDSPMLDRVRHSLLRQLNGVDVKSREATEVSDHEEGKISSL